MKYSRIRELREKENLSQRCLAERIGVSFTSYQKIENGTSDFKVSNLIKLCEFFSVTPNYLLGYDDE